jgi:hypothetical protein
VASFPVMARKSADTLSFGDLAAPARLSFRQQRIFGSVDADLRIPSFKCSVTEGIVVSMRRPQYSSPEGRTERCQRRTSEALNDIERAFAIGRSCFLTEA